jgi:hypothetical protein
MQKVSNVFETHLLFEWALALSGGCSHYAPDLEIPNRLTMLLTLPEKWVVPMQRYSDLPRFALTLFT